MDIVLQGAIYNNTLETAQYYLQLDFVDRVIISTWIDQSISFNNDDKIVIVKSNKPEISSGNMNYQIVSSREGLKYANPKDNIVAKMRSDQRIFHDSMKLMYTFFLDRSTSSKISIDNELGPTAPIYVLGIGSKFPFHPQDHVFVGRTEDVVELFNIPLMSGEIATKTNNTNFNIDLRQPIYLGAQHCSKFKPIIKHYLSNFREYLTDNAEKREEAMALSAQIRDIIFKAFPKIKMFWTKYNSDYWYSSYEAQGEYYGK